MASAPLTSRVRMIQNSQNRPKIKALLELGLILFLITTVVLAFSKLLLMRLSKSEGTSH